MLRRLHIRNFILVKTLDLEWQPGLTALTGETGAGKSIVLTALGLLLGDRADNFMPLFDGERIELVAEFSLDSTADDQVIRWLMTHDLAGDEESVLLRRIIDPQGKSRGYINGIPATIQQLKAVGELLVDIHGQHAHQLLLRPEQQQKMLDHYGGLIDTANALRHVYQRHRIAEELLQTAQQQSAQILLERSRLEEQIEELTQLNLSPEEWGTLNLEQTRLAHAASLLEAVQTSLNLLANTDQATQATLHLATQHLQTVLDYDPKLQEVSSLLESTMIQLQEGITELNHYLDQLEIDPEALAQKEARLSQLFSVARKYRQPPEELPSFLQQLSSQLAQLQASNDLNGLAQEVHNAHTEYQRLAAMLSQGRKEAAISLSDKVTSLMPSLGMVGGRFAVQLEPAAGLSPIGAERVVLQIAGHTGAAMQPLGKVASGGELSRISLALEVAALDSNPVDTLVFDEVDVGIGGSVAETVGRLLRQLGKTRQIICVTHLPQVAACAHHQMQVSKVQSDQVVVSHIQALDSSARIEEIARMLGGIEVTSTTRRHAKELLEQAGRPL